MTNFHLCKEDYSDIKSSLSMRQVAEFYGLKINNKGLCACPFHEDVRPSMKLYEKSFYCFACGTGGDLVSFVSMYFDLGNEASGLQLIEDFNLYDPRQETTYRQKREREKKIRKRRELEEFKMSAFAALNVYWQLLCEAIQDPGDRHFLEACQELSIVEYRMECLRGQPEEYFADKKAVRQIERIRNRVIDWYGADPEG